MKTLFFALACVAAVFLTVALPVSTAQASNITLPNYAQGSDVTQDVQTKGKKITDLISMIVAVASIIGMFVGAGYIGTGNSEKGKSFLIGGAMGIALAGSIYGIAALVA